MFFSLLNHKCKKHSRVPKTSKDTLHQGLLDLGLSIINCFCGDDYYYEDRNQTVDREADRNTDILMIRILFRVCQFQL